MKNINFTSAFLFYFYSPKKFDKIQGPSCSKLTTSLVKDSLKFKSSDTQIC